MKKTLLSSILILFVILANAGIHPLYAVTPANDATSSPDIQDKIKSLVKENLETTETLLQKEVAKKSLMGITGKIKSVGTKNITLEYEADLIQVIIDPNLTIISKAGTTIKTTSLALGDKLLVIGSKSKENVLDAKVINVITEEDPKTIVTTKSYLATFKDIDLKKKSFTLTINNEDLSFTLSKKTTVKLEEYKPGDSILAITKLYQSKYSLSRAKKI